MKLCHEAERVKFFLDQEDLLNLIFILTNVDFKKNIKKQMLIG